jgi:hypothetical protein
VLNQVIFEYNDPVFSLLKQRNRTELTRGLLSHTITSKLCRLAPHLISSLTQKLWKIFFITFQKQIWIPRCEQINLYEISLGISSTQKKDYKTYRPQVDQERHLKGHQNHRWRYKEGLYRCKEAITSLIIKGLIPVWGVKGFNR